MLLLCQMLSCHKFAFTALPESSRQFSLLHASRELQTAKIIIVVGFLGMHFLGSQTRQEGMPQVVFAVAPQPLLEEFHSSFLSGDLPALASHPSANFALQAFLAAANRSPLVKKLLAELKGSFKELLQRRRSGVVAAMLAACARTSTGQADASKALAAALTSLHDEGKVTHPVLFRSSL